MRLPTASPLAPTGSLNLLTPSSTSGLPALFHAGSALGVCPSELCSSRTGGSRLRHRYPRAVGTSRSDLAALAPESRRSLGSAPDPRPSPRETTESCPASGPCSAPRVRCSCRWFRPTGARSSPGLLPSRVFPLAGRAAVFTAASPRVVRHPDAEAARLAPLQGLAFRRDWLSSLEDADPPGVSHLVTDPRRRSEIGIRESPPSGSRYVAVLFSHS